MPITLRAAALGLLTGVLAPLAIGASPAAAASVPLTCDVPLGGAFAATLTSDLPAEAGTGTTIGASTLTITFESRLQTLLGLVKIDHLQARVRGSLVATAPGGAERALAVDADSAGRPADGDGGVSFDARIPAASFATAGAASYRVPGAAFTLTMTAFKADGSVNTQLAAAQSTAPSDDDVNTFDVPCTTAAGGEADLASVAFSDGGPAPSTTPRPIPTPGPQPTPVPPTTPVPTGAVLFTCTAPELPAFTLSFLSHLPDTVDHRGGGHFTPDFTVSGQLNSALGAHGATTVSHTVELAGSLATTGDGVRPWRAGFEKEWQPLKVYAGYGQMLTGDEFFPSSSGAGTAIFTAISATVGIWISGADGNPITDFAEAQGRTPQPDADPSYFEASCVPQAGGPVVFHTATLTAPDLTPTPAPEPTPTPGPVTPSSAVAYAVAGQATMKSFVRGAVPVTGDASAVVPPSGGAVSADLALAPATAKLTALGFLPLRAKLAFVPAGAASGELKGSALALSLRARIRIPSVTLFGLSLGGGSSCQTRSASTVGLNSPEFSRTAGGTLAGRFSLSGLTGCGLAAGLLASYGSGPANALSLSLTPEG